MAHIARATSGSHCSIRPRGTSMRWVLSDPQFRGRGLGQRLARAAGCSGVERGFQPPSALVARQPPGERAPIQQQGSPRGPISPYVTMRGLDGAEGSQAGCPLHTWERKLLLEGGLPASLCMQA